MIRAKNIKNKRGFTIIEVVLVLAIAGLIFLMVFVALPALQRNQRDTQRRNDYGMLSTAITTYATNNGGSFKNLTGSSGENILSPSTYINQSGEDPEGAIYYLKAYTWDKYNELSNKTPSFGTATTVAYCNGAVASKESDCKTEGGTWVPSETNKVTEVFVVIGANCNGEADGHTAPAQDLSKRAFVVYGALEGSNGTYCQASN